MNNFFISAQSQPKVRHKWFAEVKVRSTTTYAIRYRSNTGSNPSQNGWINLAEVNTLEQAEREASDIRPRAVELEIMSICRTIVKTYRKR